MAGELHLPRANQQVEEFGCFMLQGFKAAAESAAATFQQLLAAAGGFVACTAGEGAADGAGAGKAEGSCAAVYPGDKGSAAAKAAAATADSGDASAAPAPVLVSGAGHDAMVMADLTKMGMLFVRCRWVPFVWGWGQAVPSA